MARCLQSPFWLLLPMLFLLAIVVVVAGEAPGRSSLLRFPLQRRAIMSNIKRRVHEKAVEATSLEGGFEQDTAYYTSMRIGTPPQLLKMLVDTGSANVVVPDILCERPWTACTALSFYDPSNSSTAHRAPYNHFCDDRSDNNGCQMQVNYIEHTTVYSGPTYVVGELYYDLAAVASLNANTSIVAFTEESYDFQSTDFDGVLGLAYDAVAHPGTTSWFSALVHSGAVEDVFSMCLGQYGGTLVLGGSDSDLHKSEVKYTPLAKQSYYLVEVNKMTMNGIEVADDDDLAPAVIDTAFENIILPFSVHTNLVSAITEEYCEGAGSVPTGLCGVKSLMKGFCFHISPNDFSNYPTLTFQLANDVSLSLDASNYLYRSSGKYCMGITGQSADSSTQNIVFGQRLLYKYYVVFNRAEELIGFAQASNCTGATYVADIVSGNKQKGVINRSLKNDFVIRVRRLNDSEPVKGVSVSWKIQQGDGELTKEVLETDADGLASAQYTLGSVEGDHYVSATVHLALNSPVLFTASATTSNVYLLISGLALVFLVLFLLFIVYKAGKRKKQLGSLPMAASNLPESSVALLSYRGGRVDEDEDADLLSSYGVVTPTNRSQAAMADVLLDE